MSDCVQSFVTECAEAVNRVLENSAVNRGKPQPGKGSDTSGTAAAPGRKQTAAPEGGGLAT